VGGNDCFISWLARRMKAKIGPQAAQTATAPTIAVIFCPMVKNEVEHDRTIWDKRDAQRSVGKGIRRTEAAS